MDATHKNQLRDATVTGTIGSPIQFCNNGPPSPMGSTFAKDERSKLGTPNSIEKMLITQDFHQSRRRCRPSTFSSSLHFQVVVSQPPSFSDANPAQSRDSVIPPYVPNTQGAAFLTSMNTQSGIGLPSHYPGSAGHFRDNSLESSVIEELQDFDELFGLGAASSVSSANKFGNEHENSDSTDTQHNSFFGGRYNEYEISEDDDDDLNTLSRVLHISERSEVWNREDENDTVDFPPSIIETSPYDFDDDSENEEFSIIRSHVSEKEPVSWLVDAKRRYSEGISSCQSASLSGDILDGKRSMPRNVFVTDVTTPVITNPRSNHHHRSSSRMSSSSLSTQRSHRRSRNRAMSSQEFTDSILDFLEE